MRERRRGFSIAPMGPRKKRILVCDDDPVILRLLQVNLELEGFDVLSANNGSEAVEVAIAEDPDLVILDIMMPKMDGYEACERIKENDRTKDTPIIFLSAKAQLADIEQGPRAGVRVPHQTLRSLRTGGLDQPAGALMAEVTTLLGALVTEALNQAKADGLLEGEVPEANFERPRRKDHGDWATNVALVASAGGNPRSLADAIVDRLPASDIVRSVEVAGPGFLNFHLSPKWLHDIVTRAATEGSGFGRSNIGNGEKVNVEYVSANPTGPVNVVSCRQAAVGDAISSLLEATGHTVTREFYINDAGRQIELFGDRSARVPPAPRSGGRHPGGGIPGRVSGRPRQGDL